MQPLYDYLIEWNKKTDPLAKLQTAYLFLAAGLLLLAAFISLINQNLGQSVLFFSLVAGLTFVGNGVIWALVRTFVVPYLDKKYPAKSTRKK